MKKFCFQTLPRHEQTRNAVVRPPGANPARLGQVRCAAPRETVAAEIEHEPRTAGCLPHVSDGPRSRSHRQPRPTQSLHRPQVGTAHFLNLVFAVSTLYTKIQGRFIQHDGVGRMGGGNLFQKGAPRLLLPNRPQSALLPVP